MVPFPCSKFPRRIERLDEVAHNLWWSWHPQARELFEALDYPLWRMTGHNPVKQLLDIDPEKLLAASSDSAFLELYDSVITAFDTEMLAPDTRFSTAYLHPLHGPVVFFSMEFAIHNSLPIYAGGLGVLAGDICKEASDVGLPLVGVGFMYPQGYFHQHISADGWQQEIYQQLNFHEAPVSEVCSRQGHRLLVEVGVGNRPLSVAVWEVRVGRTKIYLLDTNVESNSPQGRHLSSSLYTADQEQRPKQEIVLGIGGVRVLRALGIAPSAWHANEVHTAFMMLERVREETQVGIPFVEAVRRVKASTVFTTHTPVPAGSDVFSGKLVEEYFGNYREPLGIDREAFLKLGQLDGGGEQTFNMTTLGLQLADHRNAVSRLQGEVTRKTWLALWPGMTEGDVPIRHVTNGIHVPTWVAPEMGHLYDIYISQDWVSTHDDTTLWERVVDIPDSELWDVRRRLKKKLVAAMLERAQKSWRHGEVSSEQLAIMGALLDSEVLTMGFARRFAGYKRPSLILEDLERLMRIIDSPGRPVQVIFAGKAHPADSQGKEMIHQVYTLAKDRKFQGRIAFVEDYDLHLAHYLTQGVDIWLNTPVRLQEASGTSGMKAALNGVIHLSVSSGWWYEACNGNNGWVIGDKATHGHAGEEDKADAEALYRLLETQVVPLYYDRDRSGVPHGWMRLVKETIRSSVPIFCARRMLKEYTGRMYIPAVDSLKAK